MAQAQHPVEISIVGAATPEVVEAFALARTRIRRPRRTTLSSRISRTGDAAWHSADRNDVKS